MAKFTQGLTVALVLTLFMGVVQAFGQAHRPLSSRPGTDLSPYNQPVFSDFDSDNKLDRAELSSDGALKRVSVTFGKSSWLSLPFDSGASDRGRLISGDIDNDGDADLIWISQSYPQKIIMWLGDGRGNFSQVTVNESTFSRLQGLLGASDSDLGDQSGKSPLACVPPTVNPAVLPALAQCPYVAAAQTLFPVMQEQDPRPPLLSILRKRGPPSKHS